MGTIAIGAGGADAVRYAEEISAALIGSVQVHHALNDDQIKWFNAGSALNYVGPKK